MNIKHLALFLLFSLGTGIAKASTEAEIRSLVEANIAYTNEQLSQDPNRISKHGSREFFSSGGLLNTIQPGNDVSDFVASAHQPDRPGCPAA